MERADSKELIHSPSLKKLSNWQKVAESSFLKEEGSSEFWTLWEKARVGCFERTASKHVYYLG